jgi:hypothetical protein
MMCGTRLFLITFDLAQLMLRQVRVCPNGYGAMNGHAETNVHQRHMSDVLSIWAFGEGRIHFPAGIRLMVTCVPHEENSCMLGAIHSVHYGTARSANSVTSVLANQLPRAVSCAYALPWSTLSVSMPSRPRSATVAPEMGLSPTPADGAVQTPHRL